MHCGNAIRVSQPRWVWIPVRVLIVTFLLTLLSFALSLFLAIIGLVIAGEFAGAKPHMPFAYRNVALPFAEGMAVLVWIAATVVEIRRFRQAKALAAIERAS
jgi:hypothetical protein